MPFDKLNYYYSCGVLKIATITVESFTKESASKIILIQYTGKYKTFRNKIEIID